MYVTQKDFYQVGYKKIHIFKNLKRVCTKNLCCQLGYDNNITNFNLQNLIGKYLIEDVFYKLLT